MPVRLDPKVVSTPRADATRDSRPATTATPTATVSTPPRVSDGLEPTGTGVRSEPNAAATVKSWSADFAKAPGQHLTAEQRARLPELTHRVNDTQLETFFADKPGNKEKYEKVKAEQGVEAANKLLMRGEHQKGIYGTADARVNVADNLPAELQGGPFQAGQSLRATVRFSHGPARQNISDEVATHPGLAIRIADDKGHVQDILMSTGGSGFVAKDGFAAVAALEAQAADVGGGKLSALKALGGGIIKERGLIGGLKETVKLVQTARHHDKAGVSLADHTYFTKVPFQMGDRAVKFRLVPKEPPTGNAKIEGHDGMRTELRDRVKAGPVVYELQVQGYIDPKRTPMDDARVEWDSPYVTVAELVLPQNKDDASMDAALRGVNDLSFSPFNRWDKNDDRAMKPLGSVNEVREKVYEASQDLRGMNGPATKKCPYGFA